MSVGYGLQTGVAEACLPSKPTPKLLSSTEQDKRHSHFAAYLYPSACGRQHVTRPLQPGALEAGQPAVQLRRSNRANVTSLLPCRSWAIIFSVLALGTTFLPTFSNYRSADA